MGVNRRLVILLSMVALVRCSPQPLSAPTSLLKKPAGENTAVKTSTAAASTNDSEKTKFSFDNFYHGSYLPLKFAPTDFSKFNYRPQIFSQTPLRPFSSESYIITSLQGISPPFSNIIPPIFGSGNTPSFPINPSQVFPPLSPPVFPRPPLNPPISPISFPPISNFGLYSNPFGNLPLSFSSLPISSFSSISLFSKDSPQLSEPIPNSYGPPAAAPPEKTPEEEPSPLTEPPAQISDNNSSFDQQPISFPYEPAASDAPEQQPFTPAQEYGPPNKQ